MNLRSISLTLSIFMLLALSGCGTTMTSTRPKPAPPVYDSSADRGTREPIDLDQLDLSRRNVDEVLELSRTTDADPLDLALEIVRSLESIPSTRLAEMIDSQVYDPEFTEWLELALLVRKSLVHHTPINTAAQYWQDYHYGHVLERADFQVLAARYSSYFPTPSQVAVLLPAEGGLAAAGRAIRDGIISAYMEQPGESTLRFYSSGEDDTSALAAYHQAVQDGATQVVGPLRIESTRVLAGLADHAIPLLLLNDPGRGLEAQQTTKVSSLSLSQTEEAAAVAERVLAQGQDRAIMVIPESNWGQRIEAAFASAFVQGQGQIPASAYFNPSTSDHSAVLTDVLKIDESEQRKQALQSRLGIPLEFEPIRREDFDFIFLAADSAQGRELKPLFKFHDAGDIPVYAMSRVYSGRAEPDSDRDLDGVIFPVTPWQLQVVGNPLPNLDSLRNGSFGNLFALGRDAWQLLPWLPLLAKDPDLEYHGNTGALKLQVDGHLSRQPAWAQFSAGRPTPYLWPNQR